MLLLVVVKFVLCCGSMGFQGADPKKVGADGCSLPECAGGTALLRRWCSIDHRGRNLNVTPERIPVHLWC